MIIGSHNSWSYLTPKKWWMKLIKFTAKCQDVDIRTQYEKYNVKCFDLRINFLNKFETVQVVHNHIVYDIDISKLSDNLRYLNCKNDVKVRVLLDIRNKNKLTDKQIIYFRGFCKSLENNFKAITFFGGTDLCKGSLIYDFKNNITIDDKYASVAEPKIIDDWYPRIYALFNNKKNIAKGTDKDVLLIDFVNIN